MTTFYLWKDKQGVFYITDYKEIHADGKVKIDGHGYLKVELVHEASSKADCIAHAQKITGGA